MLRKTGPIQTTRPPAPALRAVRLELTQLVEARLVQVEAPLVEAQLVHL